jgi:hypothetical protein
MEIKDMVDGINDEIEKLTAVRNTLQSINGNKSGSKTKGHRVFSAATRKRMSLAQKRIWRDKGKATKTSHKTTHKKKGFVMSAAARAKISAAQKRIHAEKKAAVSNQPVHHEAELVAS